MTEDTLIVGFGVVVILIKIALFCFAIWRLIHWQWLDAITLVLIGEFLGWLSQYVLSEWEKISKNC
ncbi:hypothetical protein ACE1AT_04700 [Pelatocladus sp. BLCC-F211]|uniref:hypothetical protein n=1 Tax=Pelatocladus sp. BLCC-F211 TaxID=3342752 RepID=UPI0035B77E80